MVHISIYKQVYITKEGSAFLLYTLIHYYVEISCVYSNQIPLLEIIQEFNVLSTFVCFLSDSPQWARA
jgi:hypothetical protein